MRPSHTLDVSTPPPVHADSFVFGTAADPAGVTITADSVSLMENGRRIVPVMGEFHYARYPRDQWRDELLKIKAGGIDVVASYVFWIHHEETFGQWDWSGDRDLRAFVEAIQDVGLRFVARIGPWCHGEVRNGGLPEWLLDMRVNLRTDDPRYLAEVKRLYDNVAEQLRGLLWKDGGPVIGVQIENEYGGEAQHLLTLKQIAIDAGLDVPLYTRTGWPELKTPIPFGRLLPLFGGYAEGFWDRELTTMPGHYWKEFFFKHVRTDAAIASEQFGTRDAKDAPDAARYPYLTCEIGPGMMSSYHRRINVEPMDVVSMVITKLGSGSNSPGYYMYHGGTNPTGREPWLQEHQATRLTNWNDLPVKSYDFQTCLGEFGQVREQYHLLRPIHLFLRDFGERLSAMPSFIPDQPIQKDDTENIRCAVRSDGRSGFVFVNNYQRRLRLPDRLDVQLELKLRDETLSFPPTTIHADAAFFWPFNFDLGDGLTLRYATAQLVCQLRDDDAVYTVLSKTGNAMEIEIVDEAGDTHFVGTRHASSAIIDTPATDDACVAPTSAHPAAPVFTRVVDGVTHHVLLLSGPAAGTLYKGVVAGRERLVLSTVPVVFDGDELRLSVSADTSIWLLPAPASLTIGGEKIGGVAKGVFTRFDVIRPGATPVSVMTDNIRPAGPLRAIVRGTQKVAEQPKEADFSNAAVWHITLPQSVDPSRKLLLRVRYTGDVARLYCGETLLTDQFYNGTPFEIGLDRFPDVFSRGLTLKILPLQQGAPIYLHRWPDFDGQPAIAELLSIDVIESKEVRVAFA